MKIHHVTVQGFGPYRGTEKIDFDAFADEGIFLITGRTGAGKSSVLDAVTFALFGRVPRYDGTAGEKVRSDHLAPTDTCEVTLEFSVPAGRHRITRSPAYMRPKQRGSGLTPVKASAELSVLRPEGWEVLETKSGNAEKFVSDVLPLSAEQFQQVILLAQGQFQEFLVADSETRRKLLSRLFDTSRFTAYSNDLDERARVLGRNVTQLSTRLGTHAAALAEQGRVDVPEEVDASTGVGLAEWATGVLAEQEQQVRVAAASRAASAAALTAAEVAHSAALETSERQQRRAHALLRREALAVQAPQIEALRVRVDAAQRAAVVAPSWRMVDVRTVEADEAAAALGGAVPDEDRVAAQVEELAAEVQRLADAVALEATLPGLEQKASAAEQALNDFDLSVQAHRDRRAEARGERADLQIVIEQADAALAAWEGLDQQVEEVERALTAARESEATQRDLDRALVAQLDAGTARTSASSALDHLVARQYAEYAGVLAQALGEGDACQVCGSQTHPAKAALIEGHVDEAALAQAREGVERAHRAATEADGVVTRLRTRIEGLAELTLGRGVNDWSVERDALVLRVAERGSLQAEIAAAKERVKVLEGELESLETALDSAQAQREAVAGRLSAAQTQWATARAHVEERRGEHVSLASLNAEVQRELAGCRALLAAVRHADLCTRLLSEARNERDRLLLEQGFADEAEARAAHLDAAQLAEVERQVTSHDRETDEVDRVLSDPSLAEVPGEAVEVEPLRLALVAARAAHDGDVLASGAAEQQHRTVAATVARIMDDLAGSEVARREYGLVHGLAATLRGQGQNERRMALESFALAAELEEIVASANLRLARMTQGRFELQHSDTEDSKRIGAGLGLAVLDAHTGESRSPRSLSGGEKFQASLALALGLAEVVTGRAGGLRLDTLFIDEGFGTLDPETLESTMATLDGLREGGRTIGLISHVAALKERIGAQLHVDVTPGGWSTITQR